MPAPIAQRPAHPWFGHSYNYYYNSQSQQVVPPYSPIQSHSNHPPVSSTVICRPPTPFQTMRCSKNKPEKDHLRIPKFISDVRDVDVLCGRGVPSKYHVGNQYFQFLIDSYQSQYIAARRSEKPVIAFYVVDLIVQERGGRFLKRTPRPSSHDGQGCSKSITSNGGGGGWEDIGRQRAYEKVCQALREGAPDVRRQVAAKEMAAADLCCNQRMEKDPRKYEPTRTKSNSTYEHPGAIWDELLHGDCGASRLVEQVSSEEVSI